MAEEELPAAPTSLGVLGRIADEDGNALCPGADDGLEPEFAIACKVCLALLTAAKLEMSF